MEFTVVGDIIIVKRLLCLIVYMKLEKEKWRNLQFYKHWLDGYQKLFLSSKIFYLTIYVLVV